ncbi:MAG: phosphate signaling complex protein PhoU [Planctomycetota bacterium]|jgi:phosphate transport system protein|nr:phosphate signaling complex protein PhoU [Planctomycetota bacterium]MDP6988083.1 phosphate signaling complex protein PhoU [Planctomycetota bacterium]
MSHYEERLEHDLAKVRKRVRAMTGTVVGAVRDSVKAVLTADAELANETILGDLPINRQSRKLDQRCHRFIAQHLPSAGHLRFISAVLRLSKTLERIGDYAETISRAAVQLAAPPPDAVARDIEMMGRHAAHTLERSLEAFDEGNVERARATRSVVGQYGATFDKVFSDLVVAGKREEPKIEDLFSLMAVINRLERVLHQAKNICEQTIFAVTGEGKEEKTFDVLFLDGRNAGASVLAEHYCRKAYPDCGTFESAGWAAENAPDQAFVAFGIEKGLDLLGTTPRAFGGLEDQVSDFDLIIDLSGDAREHLAKVPFHSVLLHWRLEDRGDPEAVYKQLVTRVRDLMALLRGEDDD